MPPSVDFVALIPEKLALLETPRRWGLQPLKSPRVLAGAHTDVTSPQTHHLKEFPALYVPVP